VFDQCGRKGVVVGVSGGVDSSVVAALAARALGHHRVYALFTPEFDSSNDSVRLGRLLTERLQISSALEDISPILKAADCYARRNDAIRSVFPEFTDEYKCKLVLSALSESNHYPIYSIVIQSPTGETKKKRLTREAYLGVVAATNFKQRTRKMIEYYHADRLQYAVAGTPNLLEYDQGFFVKNGDGAADLKPIAHLYKTQVYQLAEYLAIPDEIRERRPTTDTYSLEQSQEEFYFSLPLDVLDLCLYGRNHDIPPERLTEGSGLGLQQIKRAYAVIDSKRRATKYLHSAPFVLGPPDQKSLVPSFRQTSEPLLACRSGDESDVSKS